MNVCVCVCIYVCVMYDMYMYACKFVSHLLDKINRRVHHYSSFSFFHTFPLPPLSLSQFLPLYSPSLSALSHLFAMILLLFFFCFPIPLFLSSLTLCILSLSLFLLLTLFPFLSFFLLLSLSLSLFVLTLQSHNVHFNASVMHLYV